MVAVAALAMASCSNMDDVSVSQAEINKSKYEAAFKKYIGGDIPSNQTWGFSSNAYSSAAAPAYDFTRAAAQFGWELSEDYPVEFDQQYFDDILTYLPEEVSAGSKLTNYEFESNGEFQFSIIYSQTSAADKVGYYYYNPATQTIAQRSEVVFVENIQNFSYVQAGIVRNYGEGDFISWEGIQAQTADGYWNWGAVKARAKVFTVNVPAGYRVGFFVINTGYNGSETMYSNSSLNNDYRDSDKYYSAVVNKAGDAYLVGLEDWYYGQYDLSHVADCNDVIIAINQNTSTPPTVVDIDEDANLRIIAEDLSATEDGDFDFNDIVLDIKYGTPAVLTLQAAGGTLPLRINGDDNLEVHKLFDADNAVNTGRLTRNAVVINSSLGFTKAINSPEDAYTLKIEVFKDGEWQELTAEKGEPACKLAVDPSFKWLNEKKSIKKEFPLFLDWATNANFNSKWW